MKVHEVALDLLAPIDPLRATRALRDLGPCVLLDGSAAAGPLATRAYVLFDPVDVVSVPAGSDGTDVDPLRVLFAALERVGAATARGAPGRFRGGAAGLLSYDVGRHLERLPATARRESEVPDAWFGLYHQGLEIDPITGAATLFIAECRLEDRCGATWVERATARVLAALSRPEEPLVKPSPVGALRSNFTRDAYLDAVELVRASILEGDVYQVNLAQRFEAAFDGDPIALYARLRAVNPAPFSALVETGDATILSSSPERFLAVTGRHVEARPIKGTRPITGRADEDASARRDLETATKDGAELAMIVDLQRNDLGRVAAYGSVTVEEAGAIEEYAMVQHRVAVIRGTLRDGASTEDLLRATFPGGSITGAPKIAAMRIIEALEGVRRGVFTGSIGWIGFDGDLDLNIAIRTLVVEGGVAHFHAGGGIVLDSKPTEEYQETLDKGRALAAALGGRFDD